MKSHTDVIHHTEDKGCVASGRGLRLQLSELLLLRALALQSLLGAFVELAFERGILFGFGGGCSKLAETRCWARP